MKLSPSILVFLNNLKEHNNRTWFLNNKGHYEKARMETGAFMDHIIAEMIHYDHLETSSGIKSMQRIYRDLRFSADKSPYKTYFAGRLKRAPPFLRGGYYYRFQPGNSYIAGGFYGPVAEDLKRIRDEFASDFVSIDKLTSDRLFRRTFGELQGDKLKSAPRGYSTDLEGIEFIKMKQFILRRKFTDNEIASPSFSKKVIDTYIKMRPFFDYMSWVLTTDNNGEPRSISGL